MTKFLKFNKKQIIFCAAAFLAAAALFFQGMTLLCSAEESVKFPIIMYHNISPKQKLLGKYCVSDSQLEQDILYLKEKGFETITMTQLIDSVENGTPLPEKPVMLTFDDGYESFYKYVYPLLQKHQVSAIVSIVGEYTDLYSETEDHNVDYSHLNWDEVHELSESPLVEIQNHTYAMHKTGERKGCSKKYCENLNTYRQALEEDLGKLQTEILNYTGILPNTFTYPYGCICPECQEMLQDLGFQAALTCFERPNVIEPSGKFLFDLGRYNRPSGKSSADFFKKVLDDLEK